MSVCMCVYACVCVCVCVCDIKTILADIASQPGHPTPCTNTPVYMKVLELIFYMYYNKS